MENIRKALVLTVKDNTYDIKLPTAGQLWDIEESKALLSNGFYGNVLGNRTFWSEYSLDNIDMFSYLSILCPKLMQDLKAKTWRDLDPFDLAELKTAYKEQFLPWYGKFAEMLKSVDTVKQVNEDVEAVEE